MRIYVVSNVGVCVLCNDFSVTAAQMGLLFNFVKYECQFLHTYIQSVL